MRLSGDFVIRGAETCSLPEFREQGKNAPGFHLDFIYVSYNEGVVGIGFGGHCKGNTCKGLALESDCESK